MAWVAIGAVAFFLLRSEKQIAAKRALVRDFDLRAYEAATALADIRAAQQAYVAAGQGAELWMPKVAATLDTATKTIGGLRQDAASADARSALGEAAAAAAEFGNVDKRARDYLAADQQLMAADVVFTEGGEAAAASARQVERARLAEHQMLDASEASERLQEAMAAAGAAALVALVIALLVFPPAPRALDTGAEAQPAVAPDADPGGLSLRAEIPVRTIAPPASAALARAVSPVLRVAAELCTELGRVNDLEGLTALLARAADVMDANGLVVWLGNTTGADLRPALAHGYDPQALARMSTVPRSADNAAAAAYRSGQLQIVVSRPGSSSGAVVAPLLSAEGCIGALSAEIRDGGEISASVQALATIFAAQLAGILTAVPHAEENKTAASG